MHDKFETLTDEQLLELHRDGQKEVEDYLMVKYKNLVRRKANSMYILGGDTEDLIQEGMIGLFKAIRDYDFGRDASFATFADLCISRQMYTAIEAAGRKKHWPLNSYISLYSDHFGEEEETGNNRSLVENLSETDASSNPERILIAQENVEYLEQFIQTGLSPFERQVLELHMTGMNYVQAARVLGRDEKATDNALQRVKQKIRKAVEKNANLRNLI